MIKPPCRKDGADCLDRTVGCQTNCLEYIAYKKECLEAGEQQQKRVLVDGFRAAYVASVKDKFRKHG